MVGRCWMGPYCKERCILSFRKGWMLSASIDTHGPGSPLLQEEVRINSQGGLSSPPCSKTGKFDLRYMHSGLYIWECWKGRPLSSVWRTQRAASRKCNCSLSDFSSRKVLVCLASWTKQDKGGHEVCKQRLFCLRTNMTQRTLQTDS